MFARRPNIGIPTQRGRRRRSLLGDATNGDFTITCGATLSGYIAQGQTLFFDFDIPYAALDVTFTDCNSDFDTTLRLINSAGAQIQSQSTNACDGDDCLYILSPSFPFLSSFLLSSSHLPSVTSVSFFR